MTHPIHILATAKTYPPVEAGMEPTREMVPAKRRNQGPERFHFKFWEGTVFDFGMGKAEIWNLWQSRTPAQKLDKGTADVAFRNSTELANSLPPPTFCPSPSALCAAQTPPPSSVGFEALRLRAAAGGGEDAAPGAGGGVQGPVLSSLGLYLEFCC